MEEYEAAKESFEAGCQLSPDNTFKTWIRKCDAELEGGLRCYMDLLYRRIRTAVVVRHVSGDGPHCVAMLNTLTHSRLDSTTPTPHTGPRI